MTVDEWRDAAVADANRRGLNDLVPMLEALAKATEVLRKASWNDTPQVPVETRRD